MDFTHNTCIHTGDNVEHRQEKPQDSNPGPSDVQTVANTCSCGSGGPGFQSQVGPLVQSFCLKSLSNNLELESFGNFLPRASESTCRVDPAPDLSVVVSNCVRTGV
ncbi:unnamed protein product, partial [Brenthis ino]